MNSRCFCACEYRNANIPNQICVAYGAKQNVAFTLRVVNDANGLDVKYVIFVYPYISVSLSFYWIPLDEIFCAQRMRTTIKCFATMCKPC